MSRRKSKEKTFDTVYLMTLALSSIIFPVMITRNVDVMSGTISWAILTFLTLDFYLRTTRHSYIKKRKLKQRLADKELLKNIKDYRNAL